MYRCAILKRKASRRKWPRLWGEMRGDNTFFQPVIELLLLVIVFKMDAVRFAQAIRYTRRTTMRGNQEAYILVKVKDGKKYVCAINKLKRSTKVPPGQPEEPKVNLEKDVLWQ